jgi:hypothetical protein
MANTRKVDVPEDRPAEEQEAIQDVDPKALKGPTQSQADSISHGEGEYLREQLLQNSNVLLGAPRFVVEVALAEKQQDFYKLSEAKRLVEAFQKREVNS